MTLRRDRPGLTALVPPGEDRPLFALRLPRGLAGGPDTVLVSLVAEVLAIAVEAVGFPADVSKADSRSVVPLQLGVHALEAVRDQLRFVPSLSHTRRLPTGDLHTRDHDLRLEY